MCNPRKGIPLSSSGQMASRLSTQYHRRRRDKQVAKDSAALEGLVDGLRQKYPRAAHGTRLEQIEGLVANLQNAIEQLSDEDYREADHEQRLLKDFADGNAPLPGSDAHRKLVAAMAAQKDGGK
jgi:hypothetical protein